MITVKEGGYTWKVQLRGRFADSVRSEKAFRELIERSIAGYEKRMPAYGAALRTKSIWEVCSILGCLNVKYRVRINPTTHKEERV